MPSWSEQSISKSYQEYSPGQLESVRERYIAASDQALEILGIDSINRWLDIGPNKGVGPEVLKHLDSKLTYIDIDPDFLRSSLLKDSESSGSIMNATSLGFPKSTFEIVSALEVIEHVKLEDQLDILKQANRVLTQDGLLIISTPNKIANGKRAMSPDHKKELTPHEFDSLIKSSGFTIREDLGQWFFNESMFHRFFRSARQSPLAVFVYYHLIPWKLRSNIRDATLISPSQVKVRSSLEGETPRIIFKVCQKI